MASTIVIVGHYVCGSAEGSVQSTGFVFDLCQVLSVCITISKPYMPRGSGVGVGLRADYKLCLTHALSPVPRSLLRRRILQYSKFSSLRNREIEIETLIFAPIPLSYIEID